MLQRAISRASRETNPSGWRYAFEAAALTGILLAAFVLRWRVYPSAELGLDGYLSVGIASIPLREMLDFSVRDVHPPLYYLALGRWLDFAGPSTAAAKLPSIACGLLTLVILSRIARDWWGPAAGLVAAALLAAAPAHISMSATVRDFSLGLLLSLASTWLVLRLLLPAEVAGDPRLGATAARGHRLILLPFVVVSALALFTWYFHLVFVVGQALMILWLGGRRRRQLISALVLCGFIGLPWFAYAAPRLVSKFVDGTTVGGEARSLVALTDVLRSVGPGLVGELPRRFEVASWPAAAAGAWIGISLLAAIVGIASARSRRDAAPFAVSIIGLALGMATNYLLRSGWVSGDDPSRYLLLVVPFGILALVGVPSRLPGVAGSIATAALLVLALPGLVAFQHQRSVPPNPWMSEPTHGYIADRAETGDAVLFTDLSDLGLYRVVAQGGPPSYAVHYAGSPFLWADVESEAPVKVDAIAASHRRVWFVNSSPHLAAPSARLEHELIRAFYHVEHRWTSKSISLRLYQAGPRPPLVAVDAPFGNQIRLAAVGAAADPDDRLLFLSIAWEAIRQPDCDYSVFVHLVAPADQTVAQRDGTPRAGLAPTSQLRAGDRVDDSYVLRLPEGAPAADYEVRVGLYSGNARLTLPDGADHLVIARARLDPAGFSVLPDAR